MRTKLLVLLMLVAILVSGCATPTQAPVATEAPVVTEAPYQYDARADSQAAVTNLEKAHE